MIAADSLDAAPLDGRVSDASHHPAEVRIRLPRGEFPQRRGDASRVTHAGQV